MLANWVQETTATTGTGTITLGGAYDDSFVTVADQFSDGDLVQYMITDGNNREAGIGTFTASGSLLARTNVFETLVSGTLTKYPSATAISLSGSAIVSISSLAQNTRTGFNSNSVYTSTSMSYPENMYPNLAVSLGVADTGYYTPFSLVRPTQISKLGFYVITADATATNFRCGIYSDVAGLPNRLLIDSGNVASSFAATGAIMLTVASTLLPPGDYWCCVASDSTAIAVQGINSTIGYLRSHSHGLFNYWDSKRNNQYKGTSGALTGALPAAAGSVTVIGAVNWIYAGWQA